MILAPNWKDILRHAKSIRWMAAVAILTGADAAWPYLDGYLPIPKWQFSLITCLLSAAAIYARLSYQPKLSPPVDPTPHANPE